MAFLSGAEATPGWMTDLGWLANRSKAKRYDRQGAYLKAAAVGARVVHVTTKPREKGDPDDVRELYRASENQRAAITAERDTLVRELVAKQAEIDRALKESTSWQQHAVDMAAERDDFHDQLTIAVRQRAEAEKEAASHDRTARDLADGFEQRVKAACDAALATERRYLARRYNAIYAGRPIGFINPDITQRITDKKGAGEG
jgi:hypothetical protein